MTNNYLYISCMKTLYLIPLLALLLFSACQPDDQDDPIPVEWTTLTFHVSTDDPIKKIRLVYREEDKGEEHFTTLLETTSTNLFQYSGSGNFVKGQYGAVQVTMFGDDSTGDIEVLYQDSLFASSPLNDSNGLNDNESGSGIWFITP